jgi:hypothetical protein
VILIAGFVIIVLSAPLAGRKLGALSQLQLRWMPLVAAALILQTVVISVLPDWLPGPVASGLHLASYGMAGAFLFVNRRVPWLWLIGLGGMANLAAISANGGVMPASSKALVAAGRATHVSHFSNSTAVAHAHLAFLGDVFAWPKPLPLANVFSVGDMLLLVGVAMLIHRFGAAILPARARPLRNDNALWWGGSVLSFDPLPSDVR